MIRTQIYLTKEERSKLSILSESTGKRQAELVREAVDQFIELTSESRRKAVLNNAAGMWQNRTDLPDSRKARRSWDRS